MAYCSASDVGILCQNLLGKAEEFDTSTSPTLTAITMWLSTGCGLINTRLAGEGYSVPIPTTSEAYDVARQANALYGAWMAERSRLNTRTAVDERTRADMFRNDFYELLSQLIDSNLSLAGVSSQSQGKAYAGGISVSDKATVESDTDRIKSRFNRGQFRNPSAQEPGGTDSGDPQAPTTTH